MRRWSERRTVVAGNDPKGLLGGDDRKAVKEMTITVK